MSDRPPPEINIFLTYIASIWLDGYCIPIGCFVEPFLLAVDYLSVWLLVPLQSASMPLDCLALFAFDMTFADRDLGFFYGNY